MKDKLAYLLWAARRWLRADAACPLGCKARTRLLKRKYLVTALYRCENCALMFRVPKDDPTLTIDFYQKDYSQGFTTDCPDDQTLARLCATSFAGTEKDFSHYLAVLKGCGLETGQVLFDFGCSWGYGSWQFAQAGYEVYSYEVSQPRARYAAEKLGCKIVMAAEQVPVKVDCFFSSHVIEHLPDPSLLWQMAAKLVKPGGLVVLFMPNGEFSRAATIPQFHSIWGKVHPLLISAEALTFMAKRHGFGGVAYSSPYNVEKIAACQSDSLEGDELLFIASPIACRNALQETV
jgi:SAM-dependent methyltransferase